MGYIHITGEELYASLLQRLQLAEQDCNDPLQQAKACIQIAQQYLQQLKEMVQAHGFADNAGEIHFFKLLKPRFSARCIYYMKVYKLFTHWPAGSEQAQTGYLQSVLSYIEQFFHANQSFYAYYRAGCTHLDEHYFLRGSYNWQLCPDSHYFDMDVSFNTPYGHMAAKLLAYDLLQTFVQNKIRGFTPHTEVLNKMLPNNATLTWTGQKVWLVELTYALYASGSLNNGKASLRDIASVFEKAFGIDMGDYYHTWNHMRFRKDPQWRFLDMLKENLVKRANNPEK